MATQRSSTRGQPQRSAQTSSERKPLATAIAIITVIIAVAGTILTYLGLAASNHWPPFAPNEPTSQQIADSVDNEYPSKKCQESSQADVVAQISSDQGEVVADVELRHSIDCDISWVWVDNTLDNVTIVKHLSRPGEDDLAAADVETSDHTPAAEGVARETYSKALYAPGCVTFSVEIVDASGDVVGSLPTTMGSACA